MEKRRGAPAELDGPRSLRLARRALQKFHRLVVADDATDTLADVELHKARRGDVVVHRTRGSRALRQILRQRLEQACDGLSASAYPHVSAAGAGSQNSIASGGPLEQADRSAGAQDHFFASSWRTSSRITITRALGA